MKILMVIVSVAIGLSMGQLITGHPENGVLYCLWANLILSLYAISR